MRGRALFVLLLPVPLALAACGGTTTRTVVRTLTVTRTTTVAAPASPVSAGDQRLFAHLRSARASPGGYELDVDPAFFLSGITANAALAADQGQTCEPSACPPVPNDNLVEDESHRVYVYLLPAGSHGTVLVKRATGIAEKRITGAQLAGLVTGTSSLRLFEPLESGVWLDVHIDTVTGFAQQYQP